MSCSPPHTSCRAIVSGLLLHTLFLFYIRSCIPLPRDNRCRCQEWLPSHASSAPASSVDNPVHDYRKCSCFSHDTDSSIPSRLEGVPPHRLPTYGVVSCQTGNHLCSNTHRILLLAFLNFAGFVADTSTAGLPEPPSIQLFLSSFSLFSYCCFFVSVLESTLTSSCLSTTAYTSETEAFQKKCNFFAKVRKNY